MKIRIGTSGWHYKHWLGGVFYPERTSGAQMFEFYARHFDTVEINNSFYRLPAPQTFEAWREAAPRGFCYAVKASRFITHMKKLKDPKPSSERFFVAAERLGKKLGPILFQLPPRWKLNIERLREFLESLPREHRYVFEFREESWLVPEVFALLRRHRAALCIHDFADMKVPYELTAKFTYIRFHGPTSVKYFGWYSTRELEAWATRIESWRGKVSEVYVYFNNDPQGAAVKNALELKEMVSRKGAKTQRGF